MNIYALSSGRGPSGIAIIRLSGKSIKNSELITKKKLKSKEINLCKFYDPSNNFNRRRFIVVSCSK